jgi:hypothetical protein
MKTIDYVNLTLSEVFEEAEAIAADAKTLFGHLNERQLNWKPGADSWSVAQCLEHLIAVNSAFHPQFDRIVAGENKPTLWERAPVLPGLFGKLLVKSQAPNSHQKFKAPALAQPSTSAVDPKVVDRFIQNHRETISKLRAMERLDPARIVVTSPFMKLIIYSALDAARLTITHERRHFAQAQRVMEAEGFPT